MNTRNMIVAAALGCGGLLVVVVAVAALVLVLPLPLRQTFGTATESGVVEQVQATVEVVPTFTPTPRAGQAEATAAPEVAAALLGPNTLSALYDQLNPGVVNIQVLVQQGQFTDAGAGSGFVLDEEGRIVTNNHVVAQAQQVTVIFYEGTEVRATILGTDADSDLAVIQVEALPDGVVPLRLGDSDQVATGEWVIAIGNPFTFGGSMSFGIVSAVGRTIASGATPFDIPQAIQTDAAINPGNSGGPLLNLEGEVIGVNAQIASGGTPANAGVGFAIPVNVVRRVAPALIETGEYQWPWLGIEGAPVDLLLAEANDLPTQDGTYVDVVRANSPAAEAGLQGTSDSQAMQGVSVPTGGDVIVAVDGQPVEDMSALLVQISLRRPGDDMELTILRDGQRQQVTVTLRPRPARFQP